MLLSSSLLLFFIPIEEESIEITLNRISNTAIEYIESPMQLPRQTQIDVPFTSQAPEGIWVEPWENACEETSILMIDAFYNGYDLNVATSKNKILEIMQTKNKVIGYSLDESMDTTNILVDELDFSWETYKVENPTLIDIKTELTMGRPIISPVYARNLNNPHYAGLGPDYHVVVITGYDEKTGEITIHDPGTKNGEGIRFPIELFMSNVHDLSKPDYTSGKMNMLFTRDTFLIK